MTPFDTKVLPLDRDVAAPDGSDVRILLGLRSGGMAHFQLAPGDVSVAVEHRTIEEIWYIVSGNGEMWRLQGEREEIVPLHAGICLTIPLGTRFQFRACGEVPLQAVAITIPPWPGPDEAQFVAGKWTPKVKMDL